MIMTKKLADQLIETLMCMTISATGGVEPENIDQKQIEYAEDYAKNGILKKSKKTPSPS